MNKELRSLYPPIEPFQYGYLRVSDLHEIYYEQSGNENGIPVVFLHGGPGVGSFPNYRQYFDPEFYRIIIFDQRGCGKSQPLGLLEDNNTDALIEDTEKLRKYLGIDNWIVFGGSWGSTLALAYAIKYPDKVNNLVLRGIFLGRQTDIDWLFEDGPAAKIFPEYFEYYSEFIPEEEKGSLIEAYYKRLISDDYETRKEAGHRFSLWETQIAKLIYENKDDIEVTERDIANSRIECHYMVEKCFFPENYILDNLAKIIHIPTYIVHGRYDIVCSASNAWDLYKEWIKLSENKYKPELVFSPSSGHSQTEPENASELVGFMEKIKAKLSE